MHRTTKLRVTDINQHFVCVLCDGYIIDATTIVECLHSFCRTCIVNFLDSSEFCPVCDVQVNTTRPLKCIRPDRTLQDVIYKLIPGLYEKEMERRREFYAEHPEAAGKQCTEERCYYSPKEFITVTMEYFREGPDKSTDPATPEEPDKKVMTRHLNCPAAVSVGNLKKLIRNKFSLPETYAINIMYAENLLSDDYTLMDIAYIYSWRRAGPMKFLYTFAPRKQMLHRPTFPAVTTTTTEAPKPEPKAAEPEVAVIPEDSTPVSAEPEKMVVEEEEERRVTPGLVEAAMQAADITNDEEIQLLPTTTTEPMEVVEVPHSSPQVPPTSVLATPNGLKIKLVPLPPGSKTAKKSTAGRKPGRSRYKSAPVQTRFPRLAPYPPPQAPLQQGAATLPQQLAAMGKLPFPNVMTSPNLMLSFVPTTANSLISMPAVQHAAVMPTMNGQDKTQYPAVMAGNVNSQDKTQYPAVMAGNVNSQDKTQYPAVMATVNSQDKNQYPNVLSSVNGGQDKTQLLSAMPLVTNVNGVVVQNEPETKNVDDKTESSSGGLLKKPDSSDGQPKCNGVPSDPAVASRPAFYPPPQQTPSTLSSSPLGPLVSSNNNNQFVVTTLNSSLMAALVSTTVTTSSLNSKSNTTFSQNNAVFTPVSSAALSPAAKPAFTPSNTLLVKNVTTTASTNASMTSSPVTKMAEMVNGTTEKKFPEPSMPILQTVLCDENVGKKSPQLAAVAPDTPGAELKVDINGRTNSPKPSPHFEMSVKQSISAEFSDNDDLGCQPDLVVDEQKLEEDDSSDDNDEEKDLRKKISAIANGKEDEDSGRASSDIRSSCDDEPTATVPSASSSPRLPSFSLACTTTPTRTSKSNNINHVIDNLLKSHEQRKDSTGALDLSTCTTGKKPGSGEGSGRQKPVANPVLDIKHRQQAYLPAPSSTGTNNNNKQHTACVPSPKHPTSSPILMHGLTSPLALVAMRGKSPHLPVPPFHGTMLYTSQSRAVVPSSCVPVYTSQNRTPSSSPMFHPPRMSTQQQSFANFKGSSSSPTNLMKSPSSSTLKSSSSNARNYPSPTANHLKGLASQPQSPYTKKSNSGYKKSSHSAAAFPFAKKPPTSHSYKSYNTKFKSSGNLQVINPDPNGSHQPRLVIRNLDAKPTSPQKL